MINIKFLQFDPNSEEWSVVLTSEIAYPLHIEVPEKWASEVIKNGKFIKTSDKDGWITFKPSQ